MAFGIYKADNGNITGFSAPVQPDKGLSRSNTPRVLLANFGDGYEQRLADGINVLDQNMTISFSTRPKAEIDDLVAFFESLKGVSRFKFNLEDSNEGSSTETILCVCPSWSQTWAFDNFYTLTATFRRVYES
jgi:phage-related protein|tara:strand:+ start:624 stop:1019 length:396 start_codon:yes stop_codon:yes gene_type:complete